MNDVWGNVEDMCQNAKGMYWDGCHKIYLAMDEEEKATFIELGYEHHQPNFETLKEWFEASCGLKFVSAVFNNPEDPNAGFVSLIPQCFDDEDEDENDS